MSTTSESAPHPQDGNDSPTIETAATLLDYLAPPRVNPYLAATSGDKLQALELYLWNCAAGAALWEVLGHVEMAIRHAVDSALASRHTRLQRTEDDWLWHPDVAKELGSRAVEDIEEAHERADAAGARGRYTVTSDHIVAELNFGFWRFMFTKERENHIDRR